MSWSRPIRAAVAATLGFALAERAPADLTLEWSTDVPTSVAVTAGVKSFIADDAGNTFFTGITGVTMLTDALTAAIAPDGTLLWSHVFDSGANDYDDALDLVLGPGGVVYVVGTSRATGSATQLLILAYDAVTGALLDTIYHASAPGVSTRGRSIAVDAQGNLFAAGSTSGDASDAFVVKLDPSGALLWSRTWDGSPANSFDLAQRILLDPNGDPVVMIDGKGASNESDYVLLKYRSSDGLTLWESAWGLSEQDSPLDMQIGAAGDVFVTGVATQGTRKFGTIKLRASDGQLQWQAYDWLGFGDTPRGLALDDAGGVYVTGFVDPDGTLVNGDLYTVKRDAASGGLVWSFRFGETCAGCMDSAEDVVVDGAGRVYVAGQSNTPPYSDDMLTLVLDSITGLELDRGVVPSGAGDDLRAYFVALDTAGEIYVAGQTTDLTTGFKDVTVAGFSSFDPFWESYCAGAPNSLGAGATIGAAASASVSDAELALTVRDAAAGQPGLFFYGVGESMLPFGDGWRCVAGPSFRLKPGEHTDAFGNASHWLDFAVPPVGAGAGALTPGSRWYFQFWYLDPAAGGAGFNLSDGLAIDFVP